MLSNYVSSYRESVCHDEKIVFVVDETSGYTLD